MQLWLEVGHNTCIINHINHINTLSLKWKILDIFIAVYREEKENKERKRERERALDGHIIVYYSIKIRFIIVMEEYGERSKNNNKRNNINTHQYYSFTARSFFCISFSTSLILKLEMQT